MRGDSTVGFCGYEAVGENVLLRSIVVLPSLKGHGIGESATNLLMEKARQGGARQAYLLTTSAAAFFEWLGFVPVDRASVPNAILKTRQAASLCPASATVLTKQLQV
ncbi:GNAT family N-acetyltransferase [Aminobacter sp. MET-1]|uniref:GNAT family N-acetyltransferase n=1 Tax=Aminobacter sp. MET-1 TaxID=2951085 RepID=UPI002269D441|nr:GNAT family N-acetyltransferase [Aminobacter sp. MET-1]MCX8570832.1 GNAT family N-acetyltransferase [Aminobacter sp. MET-1]